MNFKKKTIGRMYFDGKIDISDPCYSRESCGRINDVDVQPGDYDVVSWITENGTVGIIGIYLNGVFPDQDFPSHEKMCYLESIGVDSGVAGFLKSGTELNRKEWEDFCNLFYNKIKDNELILDWGVVCYSGHGDGEYDVYALKVNDKVIAAEIRFS